MFSYCFKSFIVDFKASLQPVNVFKYQAEEENGETACLVCVYNLAYVILLHETWHLFTNIFLLQSIVLLKEELDKCMNWTNVAVLVV